MRLSIASVTNRQAGLAVLLAVVSSSSVASTTWLDRLDLAFDTVVATTSSEPALAGVLVRNNYGSPPELLHLLALANPARVSAFTFDGESLLFTPLNWANIGGLAVSPRDVARIQVDGQVEIEFTSDQLGLPPTTKLDALSFATDGLFLSIDTHMQIEEIAYGPADILLWDGAALSIFLGASDLRISPGLNVSGLHVLSNGNFLVSFSSAGEIDGVSFSAADVLEYSISQNSWDLNRDRDRLGVHCANCSIVDLSASDSPDTILRSGFESNEG